MRPVCEPIAIIRTSDEAATKRVAAALAARVRPGDVIALQGDLGAGKTTFARGFIGALTIADEVVPSPTFTLVQTYASEAGDIWHFDLYRLKRAEEAYELGIEEAFGNGISLIEWPERLGGLLPRQRLDVTLAPGPHPDPGSGPESRPESRPESGPESGPESESREIRLSGGDDWRIRLAGFWGE